MSDLLQKLGDFESVALSAIAAAPDLVAVTDVKTRFLGRNGELTSALKELGKLDAEARKEAGAVANRVKTRVQDALDARETSLRRDEIDRRLASEAIDVTREGLVQASGSHHPVMETWHQAAEIFRRMGFDVADGPEIETDFYNFEALNMPPDHPARDMQDTFYLNDGKLLRTHTSPVQIRAMKNSKPPLALVAPGVVYRRDSDMTHTPMFHQLEALVVDDGINFGHLKAVIRKFIAEIFEKPLELRFRPSFFPFTEPSAEVDMSCVFCGGKGCRVCKQTGWLEIMGCGMVDPEVFKHVGIDSARYTGFAFGVGLERVTMLKYGINDLRLFFENDVRFLKQF